MTIDPASQPSSSLTLQTNVSASSPAAPASQDSSFQQLIAPSPSPSAPQQLTALQMLFRCPPAFAGTAGSTLDSRNPVSASETEQAPPLPPPLDPSPAALWPTTVIRPNPTPELAGQAKDAVLAALQKDGMDPSKVRISYWEELVTYPGGSYTNCNITVETANGRKIDLDAAYMARCPWLAASAVRDLDQLSA